MDEIESKKEEIIKSLLDLKAANKKSRRHKMYKSQPKLSKLPKNNYASTFKLPENNATLASGNIVRDRRGKLLKSTISNLSKFLYDNTHFYIDPIVLNVKMQFV